MSDFQEFLDEQMKDPEFAEAYRLISTEVDTEFIHLLLERQAAMKPVVEAARKWRKVQTIFNISDLIKAVDEYEKHLVSEGKNSHSPTAEFERQGR